MPWLKYASKHSPAFKRSLLVNLVLLVHDMTPFYDDTEMKCNPLMQMSAVII